MWAFCLNSVIWGFCRRGYCRWGFCRWGFCRREFLSCGIFVGNPSEVPQMSLLENGMFDIRYFD